MYDEILYSRADVLYCPQIEVYMMIQRDALMGAVLCQCEDLYFFYCRRISIWPRQIVLYPPAPAPRLGLSELWLTEQHPLYTLSPSLIALMCCDCVGVAVVCWVGGVGVGVGSGWGGFGVAAKSVLQ